MQLIHNSFFFFFPCPPPPSISQSSSHLRKTSLHHAFYLIILFNHIFSPLNILPLLFPHLFSLIFLLFCYQLSLSLQFTFTSNPSLLSDNSILLHGLYLYLLIKKFLTSLSCPSFICVQWKMFMWLLL